MGWREDSGPSTLKCVDLQEPCRKKRREKRLLGRRKNKNKNKKDVWKEGKKAQHEKKKKIIIKNKK